MATVLLNLKKMHYFQLVTLSFLFLFSDNARSLGAKQVLHSI